MPDNREEQADYESLSRILANLESRISRIEEHLNLEPVQLKEKLGAPSAKSVAEAEDETLEFKIGLYWFAKVGIVALLIGIVFLLMRPFSNLPSVSAPILGYFFAAVVTLFSRSLHRSSPFLSGYLLGSGLALLFFSTLRFHYFSAQPVLSDGTSEVIFLWLITLISLIVSVRRRSNYITAISLTMGYCTALLSDGTYAFFAALFAMSVLTVYLELKYKWPNLLIFGIVATYFSQLLWFMNNPLLGNALALREVPYFTSFLILLWVVIFSCGNYFRGRDQTENVSVILSSLLNAGFAYALYLLITISKFQGRIPISHFTASLVFLILAMAFWSKEKSKLQTFFYAMTGYAALSVAIIAQFRTPDFFIWLSWQSLIVVSTSVWFRSKSIVVANFFIYAIIFIAYLILAGAIGITSLSFGVVALLSARILNWQKHRLELKTELMRNAYLIAAFFIFPYALYNIVPSGYVSLSWMAVAIVYYVISLILKNTKYRWMAFLTLLFTAFYLLIIGIIKLEPAYRIVSFLILGVVLLGISFIYAQRKTKSRHRET